MNSLDGIVPTPAFEEFLNAYVDGEDRWGIKEIRVNENLGVLYKWDLQGNCLVHDLNTDLEYNSISKTPLQILNGVTVLSAEQIGIPWLTGKLVSDFEVAIYPKFPFQSFEQLNSEVRKDFLSEALNKRVLHG